jgi:nucleotide-binding universal stress UspA family protein
MTRMTKVLCAFDASEPSLLAAHAAAWLTQALGAQLELVYVVDHDDLPALPPHGAGIDPDVRDALPVIQEQIAEDAACADLRATLAGLPDTDVTGTVLTGAPVTAIRQRATDTDAAHEHRACLVVAGTRGRGPLRGELFGSVSTGLVRIAARPVVLVSEHAGH